MCRDRPVDVVLKELEAVGIPATVRWRRHPQVRFEIGEERLTYVVPGSTSDNRALINCRSGIRRILRSHGYILGK